MVFRSRSRLCNKNTSTPPSDQFLQYVCAGCNIFLPTLEGEKTLLPRQGVIEMYNSEILEVTFSDL